MELRAQLEQLHECGAHRFNPVQFSFINALIRRAQKQPDAVASMINKRAQSELKQYRAAFSSAQKTASVTLAEVTSEFPHSAGQLKGHFERCEFAQMNRLVAKLQLKKRPQSLVDLARYVEQSGPLAKNQPQGLSFDDILRQQERSLVNSGADVDTPDLNSGEQANKDELSSIHYFRESLVRSNADKLVTQAIREIPEGAGPLNSQKLIVQSLSSMRDLSPHYLNRFVAYIDTLLWLDRAGDK